MSAQLWQSYDVYSFSLLSASQIGSVLRVTQRSIYKMTGPHPEQEDTKGNISDLMVPISVLTNGKPVIVRDSASQEFCVYR